MKWSTKRCTISSRRWSTWLLITGSRSIHFILSSIWLLLLLCSIRLLTRSWAVSTWALFPTHMTNPWLISYSTEMSVTISAIQWPALSTGTVSSVLVFPCSSPLLSSRSFKQIRSQATTLTILLTSVIRPGFYMKQSYRWLTPSLVKDLHPWSHCPMKVSSPSSCSLDFLLFF